MSKKIDNDKYYTNTETAKYCVCKTLDIVGISNIAHIIEPSAGAGAFLNIISMYDIDNIALDILPEHPLVIKQDFLSLNIPYIKGRLIIGNPPYGEKLGLAKKIHEQSINHM